MVDYAVNEDFDIFFEENRDLAVVDGLEEFEDDLLIQLHYQLGKEIGNVKRRDTLQQKVELLATRLAKENDLLSEIEPVAVTEPPNAVDTLAVELVYSAADNFQETL